MSNIKQPELKVSRKVGRIRDVARETGLSTATISRVMNGGTNVAPETRARVLAACDALDYVPNSAARALSTSKSKTIAAIIPSIEHSIFAKYVTAIEETLAAGGYSLVLAISNAIEEAELVAARKLLGMGAEAFILSGSAHSTELMAVFDRRNVPVVFTSVWEPDSSIPTIGYDNFNLASQAIEHIANKGHDRIAVLHGPLAESDRTRARRSGAEAARRGGMVVQFFETSLDVSGGKQAIGQVLKDRGGFTATLCCSDVLALGAYFGLSEAGVQVPRDMSVMGFDNLDWSGSIVPALTTINLPARRMGVEVASQLMAHLENNEPLSETELIGQIVERHSIAKRG